MNKSKEQSPKSQGSWSRLSLPLKISWVILGIVIIFSLYAIMVDPWNASDSPYGAGDYYYTDVEGFDFSIGIGTTHPIIFVVLFVAWALVSWRFVSWIESKK